MASNEQMRAEFEKWFEEAATSNDYVTHWMTWQAAISSLPRMTEQEIAAVFREADFETAAEGGHSNDIYPKAARALIAKLPHIMKE